MDDRPCNPDPIGADLQEFTGTPVTDPARSAELTRNVCHPWRISRQGQFYLVVGSISAAALVLVTGVLIGHFLL